MNIKFLGSKVKSLSLFIDDDNLDIEDNINFSFTNAFSEEKENTFLVKFDVEITSKEEGFSLKLEYIGFFETDKVISDDFINSHFPSVNAPAIAYPFMRSFINTVTVNSGLSPILLPTINFQELARKQTETNKSI